MDTGPILFFGLWHQFSCHHLLHTFLFTNVFGSPVPKHVHTLGSSCCFWSLHVRVGAIPVHCWLYCPGCAVPPSLGYSPTSTVLLPQVSGLSRVFCGSIWILGFFFLNICEKWHEEFWLDLKIWIGSELKVSSLGTNFRHSTGRCCVRLQKREASTSATWL